MCQRLVLALCIIAAASSAFADEVVVLSAVEMKGMFEDVSIKYAVMTGRTVRFIYGTAGQIRDNAASGKPFDLAVVPPIALGALLKQGLVQEGAPIPLGVLRIGMAVRKGVEPPSIDTVDDFKAALRDAGSIGIPDPNTGATAGMFLDKLFDKLGLATAVSGKLKLFRDGPSAVGAAARGEVSLALAQMNDIVQASGVTLVGKIPEEVQQRSTYSISLAAHPLNPDGAHALADYLTAAAQMDEYAKNGFEPPRR